MDGQNHKANTSWVALILPDRTAQLFSLGDPIPSDQTSSYNWIHIHRDDDASVAWLEQQSGLDPIAIEALLANETRPRCTRLSNGFLLNLRGVNLNPGSEPDDMVSIRLWAEENRIISVYLRRLNSVGSLSDEIRQGRAPANVGQFMVSLADKLATNMQPVIENLSESISEIEEAISMVSAQRENRVQLGELRRQIIRLRRYIAPQREALAQLLREDIGWITRRHREEMQHALDQTLRIVEELENLRDRAAVIQDEVESRISDELNRNMYILSIVAVIFLPLGFITGLLGINVAGIPGAETSWAFVAATGGLTTLAVFEFMILKRIGWL